MADSRKILTGNAVCKAIAEAFGLDHRKIRRIVLDADVRAAAVLYVEEYAAAEDANKATAELTSKLAVVTGDPEAHVRVVVV